MTGPQFREPRKPPEGLIGPGLVLGFLIAGAATALVFAFLLRP